METEATTGKLTATRREGTGKGLARKLRAKGLVPAICYGRQGAALPITVDPVALRKAMDKAKRYNTVIELTVEGGEKTDVFKVMLKDHQEDTLKRTLLHVDFVTVTDDQVIEVSVPLVLEGKSEGVKLGGNLHQVFRALPIRCTPSKIPTQIVLDISALNIGDSIRVKDITSLGEGITVNLPPNQSVTLVMAPKKVVEATEEAAAVPAEGEPAAEGKAEEGKKEKDAG